MKNLRPSSNLVLDTRLQQSIDDLHLALGAAVKETCNPLFGEEMPW